uniref:HMG box domain-containing protein n=1 Tax=Vannella robusta TaxID=1487602 RepID=A0A7S4IJQ4_9EUKA|mmetsp:Transcript_3663/g.4524  ORF Transcript_3663/g.4524 Transcript_3663/m.4524 type:complete len:190 (+) Transcript_3663:52-621(+)
MPKPANSFFLFCNDHRKPLHKLHGKELSNSEITSLLAKMWRELCPEEKQRYKNLSEGLRTKFNEENPDYSTPKTKIDEFQFSFKVQPPSTKPPKQITKPAPQRIVPPKSSLNTIIFSPPNNNSNSNLLPPQQPKERTLSFDTFKINSPQYQEEPAPASLSPFSPVPIRLPPLKIPGPFVPNKITRVAPE